MQGLVFYLIPSEFDAILVSCIFYQIFSYYLCLSCFKNKFVYTERSETIFLFLFVLSYFLICPETQKLEQVECNFKCDAHIKKWNETRGTEQR